MHSCTLDVSPFTLSTQQLTEHFHFVVGQRAHTYTASYRRYNPPRRFLLEAISPQSSGRSNAHARAAHTPNACIMCLHVPHSRRMASQRSRMNYVPRTRTHTHKHSCFQWFPEVVCQVVILLVNYARSHETFHYLGSAPCASERGWIMENPLELNIQTSAATWTCQTEP